MPVWEVGQEPGANDRETEAVALMTLTRAQAGYEVPFTADSQLSEPGFLSGTPSQSNGIEDAGFDCPTM